MDSEQQQQQQHEIMGDGGGGGGGDEYGSMGGKNNGGSNAMLLDEQGDSSYARKPQQTSSSSLRPPPFDPSGKYTVAQLTKLLSNYDSHVRASGIPLEDQPDEVQESFLGIKKMIREQKQLFQKEVDLLSRNVLGDDGIDPDIQENLKKVVTCDAPVASELTQSLLSFAAANQARYKKSQEENERLKQEKRKAEEELFSLRKLSESNAAAANRPEKKARFGSDSQQQPQQQQQQQQRSTLTTTTTTSTSGGSQSYHLIKSHHESVQTRQLPDAIRQKFLSPQVTKYTKTPTYNVDPNLYALYNQFNILCASKQPGAIRKNGGGGDGNTSGFY